MHSFGIQQSHKTKTTPALSSKILQRDEDGPDHETVWDYRRVIGQLNFLENHQDLTLHMQYTSVPGLQRIQGPVTNMQYLELEGT